MDSVQSDLENPVYNLPGVEVFRCVCGRPAAGYTVQRNPRLPCVFRLNSSDDEGEPVYIQMVSALVLQLIQCVVHLPSDKDHTEDDHKKVLALQQNTRLEPRFSPLWAAPNLSVCSDR